MPHRRSNKVLKRFVLLLVFAVTLLAAWRAGWPHPVEALDNRQPRLDQAAPLPSPDLILEQSFIAQHDGLSAVELLLVVHSPGDQAIFPAVFTLRLIDDAGKVHAASSWDNLVLAHNDPIRFYFSPIKQSADQRYRLRLEGSAGNRATAWAFSLDGYTSGELTENGQPILGDLCFKTIYRLNWTGALEQLSRMVGLHASLIALLLLILFLPGLVFFPRHLAPGRDLAVHFGLALAGSLVILPLVWLWFSFFGLRWTRTLWLALVGLLILVLVSKRRYPRMQIYREHFLLLGIFLLALAVRLLAIRDMVMPAWVDSPQHWLISKIMADTGQIPYSYRPWMPVDVYWYHFGFHSLAACLNMISGISLEVILLVGGQVMNALIPLSMYGGTVLLTKRRGAGLVAAFFTAFLSLFPAFYVTWGRYTQLTGLLILPPLMGLGYQFIDGLDRRRWDAHIKLTLCLGMILGGLFMVHARVWVFAVLWLPLAALARMRRENFSRVTGWYTTVFIIAFLVTGPWWIRVIRAILLPLAEQAGSRGDPGAYNAIPWEYLNTGWERMWLALAGLGLFWSALIVIQRNLSRYTRRTPLPAADARIMGVLAAWILAVFAVINANQINVPTFGLVNNNTFIISLFVPVGIIIGWLVDEWYRLARDRYLTALLAQAGLVFAVIWCGLWGARQMVDIINHDTVFVTSADLELIDRAQEHLSEDSLVGVNAWLWMQPGNWAGSDAGYWLNLLSGQPTTMPPIGYRQNPVYGELVNNFNQQMAAVEDWESAGTLEMLNRRGVTHIFIGERGGFFKPELLIDSPNYRLLESNGSAWLFEVK